MKTPEQMLAEVDVRVATRSGSHRDTTGGLRHIAQLARRAALGREPWHETLIEIAVLAEALAFWNERASCSLAVNQQSVCTRASGLDIDAEASEDASSK